MVTATPFPTVAAAFFHLSRSLPHVKTTIGTVSREGESTGGRVGPSRVLAGRRIDIGVAEGGEVDLVDDDTCHAIEDCAPRGSSSTGCEQRAMRGLCDTSGRWMLAMLAMLAMASTSGHAHR